MPAIGERVKRWIRDDSNVTCGHGRSTSRPRLWSKWVADAWYRGPRNVATSCVRREIMDPNEIIIEVADHRRRLQLIKDAVLDAQDLCARARSTVQASQELLQEVDDLYRSNVGPVLHKNKCGV